MDIFISWSGARSLAVAEALRDWLPMIINAAKPFLSVADIDKGARWSSEIATKLEKAKAGIICLTPGNVGSHWILFEAGALSKTVQNTYVCPLLIGLKPSDVKGPLAQFQFTTTDKSEMLQLFKTLNSALGEAALPDSHVEKAFGLVWPQLEGHLKKAPPEEVKTAPERSEREMLEEMLELVRSLGRAGGVEVYEEVRRLTSSSPSGVQSLEDLIMTQLREVLRMRYGESSGNGSVYRMGDSFVVVLQTIKGFSWSDEFSADQQIAFVLSNLKARMMKAYERWLVGDTPPTSAAPERRD